MKKPTNLTVRGEAKAILRGIISELGMIAREFVRAANPRAPRRRTRPSAAARKARSAPVPRLVAAPPGQRVVVLVPLEVVLR